VAPWEQRTSMDTTTLLRDRTKRSNRCWYLEKADQDYRNSPGREAVSSPHIMPDPAVRSMEPRRGRRATVVRTGFHRRIDIGSTRAYVTSFSIVITE